VKNKHEGIFPIGSNAKRKIPRNMEENDDSFIIDVTKLVEEFEKFLKSLSGAYDNLMKEKEEVPADKEIDSYFQTNFPEFESDIRPFVEALKWIKKKDWKSATFMSLKDNLTIYQVLSFFLLNIYKYCSRSFFKEYVVLFCMLIRALNDKGQMFLDKDDKQKNDGGLEEVDLFCHTKKIHISAEILNLFIAELFPKYLRKLEK